MRLLLRNLLIASLFLLPAGHSYAQKISFCDTTNLWVTTGEMDAASCGWERKGYLGSDTLIAGHKYRKFNYLSHIYTSYSTGCNATMGKGFFVREEPAYGMVYYRQPSVDQYEHVLYNYNLQPGDTINYRNNMWGGGSVADSLVRLDSTLIGGVYHKTFDFQSVTGRGNRAYSVIEGVGCVNHPFFPAYAGACNGYSESLKCFSQAGLVQDFSMRLNECDVLGNNFYTNCDYIPATTNVGDAAAASMSIVPNPADDKVEITFGSATNGRCTVLVHDVLGREVAKVSTMEASANLLTGSWMPGTYFVTVTNGSGFCTQQVIVVRH